MRQHAAEPKKNQSNIAINCSRLPRPVAEQSVPHRPSSLLERSFAARCSTSYPGEEYRPLTYGSDAGCLSPLSTFKLYVMTRPFWSCAAGRLVACQPGGSSTFTSSTFSNG